MMCDICLRICNAVRELTANEGNGVNILAANAGPGPSNAVEVTCDWNNWVTSRYEGASLVEALEAAVDAKRFLEKMATSERPFQGN